VADKLEKLSVAEALRAIDLAHVVVLVVDAAVGMDRQDMTIADRVLAEGRALLIAVNKWDLVDDRAAALKAIENKLERSLAQGKGVPVLTLSALTGRHVDRLMPGVFALYDQWNRRFPTAALNRWLAAATAAHPPPAVQGRHIRIRYATQIKTRPPTIALFASRPEKMPEAYGRYLVNDLRQKFDLPGVPVRLVWRKGKNPFAPV
jgi:GTP-binding protein